MVAAVTSGSTSYTQSAYDLICGALRLCSVIADDETPIPSSATNALSSLNAMVKGWQASGIHVWTQEEAILFLQPNQPQYSLGTGSTDSACLYTDLLETSLSASAGAAATSVTLASTTGIVSGTYVGVQLDAGTNFFTTATGPGVAGVVPLASPLPSAATSGALAFAYQTPLIRPLRAPAGRRYLLSTKIATPMIPLSRVDYDMLPNQYNPGTVTQYFFDPQTGNNSYTNALALMNLWPMPADNTAALRFISQRPLQSFSTLANVPDFPDEWVAALKWNLAEEIALEFDVPADRLATIRDRAAFWFDLVKAWDREPESILFGVAFQPGYRR